MTGVLQVPRRMIGTDAFQETPIVEVTRQITKHNYLVMDIADLPRVLKEVQACQLLLLTDLAQQTGHKQLHKSSRRLVSP